jgi:hypothetical protein
LGMITLRIFCTSFVVLLDTAGGNRYFGFVLNYFWNLV